MGGTDNATVFAVADRLLRSAGQVLVDIVYPMRCAGCRERGTWLCATCNAHPLRFDEPLCPGCGVPAAFQRCHCRDLSPELAAVRSVGDYSHWLREAIRNFKYHGEWARKDHLGAELASVVAEMPSIDALVPVPLHASRLRERGYNQSALLAGVVELRLGVPVCSMLRRTRATLHQVGLSGPERAANVADAFTVDSEYDPSGKDLVLVDDVVTTSSTLNACACALIRGGANSVRAATLAREL